MKLRRLIIIIFLAQLVSLPGHAQELLLTPENGLTGLSEGEGSLRFIFGQPRAFHVRSDGQSERDGSFTLKQTLAFEGQQTQSRSWSIRQDTPLHYTGTLSDATGVVTGETSGQRLSITYRIKGPFVMHQILERMPDGKTIDNVGHITLFGITVGFMHETIRHGD